VSIVRADLLGFLLEAPVSFKINHRMTKPIKTVARANQAPLILSPLANHLWDLKP
jgi:hypothetical protein